jgi:thiamine kinase-like enzyme
MWTPISAGRTILTDGNKSDDALAREALSGIPGFDRTAARARFTRLRGLTNLVFKVELGDERLCLRVPGPNTAAIIDRRAEEVAARAAARANIAPDVLYFGADGVMLTRFVEDALPLSPQRLREDAGAARRVALALRRLHDTVGDFPREFQAFDVIDGYVDLLRRLGASLPDGYAELADNARRSREALAAHPARLRPCHCDPTGANLLDTGERIWMIDWEYSGMNDPTWDLAYLSVQAAADEAFDRRVLEAYLSRPPAAAESGRMIVYKAVCELMSALWALIQLAGGNTAGDFRGYAETTFGHCRETMRSAEFARQLDAVSQG